MSQNHNNNPVTITQLEEMDVTLPNKAVIIPPEEAKKLHLPLLIPIPIYNSLIYKNHQSNSIKK